MFKNMEIILFNCSAKKNNFYKICKLKEEHKSKRERVLMTRGAGKMKSKEWVNWKLNIKDRRWQQQSLMERGETEVTGDASS